MRYFYGRRRHTDPVITIIALLLYALIKFWVYYPVLCTVLCIVVIVVSVVGGKYLIENDYKNAIYNVNKIFHAGKNTIKNNHCTVQFSYNEKLIVMENVARRGQKRMFTLLKKNGVNVNKFWGNTCKTFDDFATFDSLAILMEVENKDIVYLEAKAQVIETPKTPAPKQINIDNSNIGPRFVEMGAIVPDTFGLGGNVPNQGAESFVNLDSVNKAKPVNEREQQAPEFVEMNDVLSSSSKKIDVNNVEASELSILPGINIVQAKKLIEYRNTNGLFKSEEDFIKIANVKPHFVSKIKSMIIVNDIKNTNVEDDNYEGRIIDF